MKKVLFLVVIGVLIFAAVGQNAPARPAQAQDDTLIVATDIRDLQSLDTAQNGSPTNLAMFYTVYERLYELPANPAEPLIPNLATGHTVSEDGLVWTFNLREGVTFASGNPFTAEDVVFSWMRVWNFQNEPAQVFNLFVSKIEALDPLTVQVTLSTEVFPRPSPIPFFDSLTALPSLSILDSQLLMENGGSMDPTTDTAGEWLNQNSAGSAPYVLAEWEPEVQLTLERNDAYWGENKAAIQRVVLRQVNESTTAFQLAEEGEVDIAQNIDKDLAEFVENSGNLELEAGQTLQIVYLALSPSDNFADSPLTNRDVRRAIVQAIDYDGIINGLLGGFAIRPGGVVPIGILGAAESESLKYERNVDAARELMAQAGYADGFELTLNLSSVPLGGLPAETLAAKLADDLNQIGIDLEINIQAPAVFTSGRNNKEFSMYASRFAADFFDPTNWTLLFAVPDFQNVASYVQIDNVGLSLAALNTLFTAGEGRPGAVLRFQQQLANEAYYSVLYQPQTIDAVSSEVSGYQFHPIALIDYKLLSK